MSSPESKQTPTSNFAPIPAPSIAYLAGLYLKATKHSDVSLAGVARQAAERYSVAEGIAAEATNLVEFLAAAGIE